MKRLKVAFAILLTVVMTVSCVVTAFAGAANGTVTYDGSAQKFVFAPGSKNSPSDLFTRFKDLMPGDTVTEQITVKNDASDKVKVEIYMRALGAEEGSKDFLSQLNLTVKQASGSKTLFKAPADQKAGLEDWVCLGLLYAGGTADLDLTLEVPATLGNEYQNAVGLLDWQFMVKEYPIEPDDPVPPLGDMGGSTLWVALALIALTELFVCIVMGKKKKAQEEA